MKVDIQVLIKSFFLEDMQNYMVVRHYNMLDIEEKDLPFADFDDDIICLFHSFQCTDIKAPYEPFLPWVKYIYEEKYSMDYTPLEFLKACGVYYCHLSLFENYLLGKKVERREEVIVLVDEMRYERKKMLENFYKIISFILQKYRIFMLIQHGHLADIGFIHLLEKLMPLIDSKDFKLLMFYNEQYRMDDTKRKHWDVWYSYVLEHKYEYAWEQKDRRKPENLSKKFVADRKKIDEYIKKLCAMLGFLAFDDVLYYSKPIYLNLDKPKTDFSLWQMQCVSYLYIYTLISLEDGAGASLAIEKVSKLCDFNESNEANYYYYYLKASYGFRAGNDKEVEKSSKKAVQIAKKIGNDRLLLNAEIYEVMTKFAGWQELYFLDFNIKVNEDLIRRLIESKYYNALAYIYCFGFDNDPENLSLIAEGKKEPVYFNRTIQICEYTKNYNLLVTAYMKNVLLYNKLDYHEYASKIHEKRLAVFKREGEVIRVAHGYTGLGYNATIQENYEKADKFFNDAIVILYQNNIADETGEVLYNMAMNCFSARMYRQTVDILDILYSLLEKISLMSIRLCSSCKLYTISTLSYYYLGEEYNSYRHFLKIENVVTSLLEEDKAYESSDSEWMYYYICKMVLSKDETIEERQKIFEKLEFFYKRDMEEQYIFATVLAKEYSEFLREQGKDDEADRYILDKIKYCEKQKMDKKKSDLEYMQREKHMPPVKQVDVGLKSLTKEQILTMADIEGVRLQLKERERDINFLRIWQEILNRDDLKTDELKLKAIGVLQNTYGLDSVISFRKEKDGYTISYMSQDIDADKVNFDAIYQFMRRYNHSFLCHRLDKNYSEFLPLERAFEGKRRSTLIGIFHGRADDVTLCAVSIAEKVAIQRTFLQEKTLFTIEFAVEQMYVALERIQNREMLAQMKDELEKMAVTDKLTGLYNRQGFSLKIQDETRQQERYNVLLYVDLDNFKFYNDTYGHEIGDLVLKRFSEIFLNVIDEQGYAVRYGGDEFLLVLQNSDEEHGVEIAKRIYDKISDGFQGLLRDYMNTTVIIPHDKRISCSIGIAKYLSGDKSRVFEALSKADALLYQVKKNGKGRYEVA